MRCITTEQLEQYKNYLLEEEKSMATINKYLCDIRKLKDFANGREITKKLMIAYKEHLRNDGEYKTSSINSFLVAANRLFEYLKWYDLRVKTYKMQNSAFIPENKDLTKAEYKRLVQTAKRLGKTRISMILQTICATGIRVSELSAITVSSVKNGVAEVYNKGKERQVLIPKDLRLKLLQHTRKSDIKSGIIFRTSTGKAIDRTNIWREMKKLCREAGVDEDKVFPHNLRHLFAKTFYQIDRDIAKLADILGHSSIETTRIYTKTSSCEHRKKLDKMRLSAGV